MVRFGPSRGGKNKDPKNNAYPKTNPKTHVIHARQLDNPVPRTKARYWSCRAW